MGEINGTATVENNGTVELSLGKRLRQLTNNARTTAEWQNFVNILTEAANRGEDHVSFDDLREVLPLMIQAETAYKFIEQNDLQITGQVNPNTAKHEMTVFW